MSAALVFDRATGRLDGASLVESGVVAAMRVGARATAPMGHHGFPRGCRMLGRVHDGREIVVRLDEDAVFAFPLGDGYWSLLLDRGYEYEPELARFLKANAEIAYTFIDAGANFGFWSVLASSRPYGAQRAVAIEASAANAARASRNAALNGGRFSVLHRAVSATTGGEAVLSGLRHEALSIAGPAQAGGERVRLVALDSLIDEGLVPPQGPYVIKLDVEGVEIAAIAGARRLLAGDAIAICEEHGSDPAHTVSRHLVEEVGATLFVHDPASGRFEILADLARLDRIKTNAARGYNIFATTSTLWIERLRAMSGTGR